MLLYSTVLETRDIAEDDFIRLVIRCNQENPYPENVIRNLKWNGERNVRYGDDDLWLEIAELKEERIIAVRYEKKAANGAVWDTDYVMDFAANRISVQLERSYTEGASLDNQRFTTPHFISMLISSGYLADDNGLPVLNAELEASRENAATLVSAVTFEQSYRLPVVYISKRDGKKLPFDVRMLCSRLKGNAHVIVARNRKFSKKTSEKYGCVLERNGDAGVYFPNGTHMRIPAGRKTDERIAAEVLKYMALQKLPELCTWQGVANALMLERIGEQKEEVRKALLEKEKAEGEISEYFDEFDADNEKLKLRIEELMQRNTRLEAEVNGLRTRLSSSGQVPVLFGGKETDLYPGEISEMVLDAVSDGLERTRGEGRRADVYGDILQSNGYVNLRRKRQAEVKRIFTGYRVMTGSMKKDLEELGITVTGDGKHYKLAYYGDPRYVSVISKTGSDRREGANVAAVINATMM